MIDPGAREATSVSLEAFHQVWPRFLPLDDLRSLLGPGADELLHEVLGRQVSAPIWTLVDRGGKRWRAMIGRLAYGVAGGAEPAPASVFEVPELLHNASLIVDDIEDAATERRGGPPVHLSYGIPIALNAANAAYFRASAVLRDELPDRTRLRALDMLSEELLGAHLGQALDLTLGAYVKAGAPVRVTHYETLARAKTGGLVRIAARLGAIAADAAADLEDALAVWAGELGIAYQIRDDLDDLAEGAADLAQGRITYPTLLLLDGLAAGGAATGAAGLGEMRGAIQNGEADQRICELLASREVRERCREAARAAGLRAAAALAPLPDGPHRDALVALTARLAGGFGDAR